MSELKTGDTVTWIGTAHLFEQTVRIVAVRNSYLTILGEGPENGHPVYDIDARPRIKGVVFGIPREQLIRQ